MTSISLLEKDPSLGFIIEAIDHSIKGRRCLYISSSMDKGAEEIALVARAVEYLEGAKESLFLTKDLPHDEELLYAKKVVEDLDLMCISARIRINALFTQKSYQIEQIVGNLSLESQVILGFFINIRVY